MAASSALKRYDDQHYSVDQLYEKLERIEKLLIAHDAVAVKTDARPTPPTPYERAQAIISNPTSAQLLPAENGIDSTCSACGAKQHPNRSACYRCGAKFTDPDGSSQDESGGSLTE
ncbi:hypothetical protein LJC33_09110 [Eubacteriales bacterium OttesenSCG-928-N13]|nr:hypothetical protein [Eubacteriales bacterium OttesenSCG-928-N13]